MQKQKRILAAASMNGGAESIGPVVKRAREQGGNVRLLAYGASPSSFRSMGLEPDRIIEKGKLETACNEEIAVFNPSAILTGVQVQDQAHKVTMEQLLWREAKTSSIPSLAVFGAWENHAAFFSDLDVLSPTNKYAALPGKMLVHLPDKIAIVDDFALRQMLELGFPQSLLYVTGNPYFEYVSDSAAQYSGSARQTLLEKPVFVPFWKGGKLVAFMSDDMNAYPDIGFTEKSVMQSFLKVIDSIAKNLGRKINVLVRPHPFRGENAQEAFQVETPHIIKILHHPSTSRGADPQNDYSMEELLLSSDIVAGTFNNPLVTAKILGRTTIHYQPNISPKYDFHHFLSAQGISTLAKDEGSLKDALVAALRGSLFQKPIPTITGAIARVTDLLFSLAEHA